MSVLRCFYLYTVLLSGARPVSSGVPGVGRMTFWCEEEEWLVSVAGTTSEPVCRI